MELAGNTVLITGGSSGIGLALVEQWLTAGLQVHEWLRGQRTRQGENFYAAAG